jgi:hypothetical protein
MDMTQQSEEEQLRLFDPGPPTFIPPLPPHPRSLGSEDPDEGAWFDYERCPEVFLGRRGLGPLRVAWDTNILIDYGIYGAKMWEEEEKEDGEFNPQAAPKHRKQLLALCALMYAWMNRDIRIHVFDRQIDDAKKELPEKRKQYRVEQITQIASALHCLQHQTVDPTLPDSPQPRYSLDWMPESTDRELVEAAIEAGCHVFLTNDADDILKHGSRLLEYGIVALSPSELVNRLDAAGELGWSEYCSVFVDNHKWLHVMKACG